jgi:tRNA G18 (ribose-2'-O)-methylase SpoU
MITKYSHGTELPSNASSNLIDIYKSWTDAEIRADLQPRRSDLVMVYQNIGHDFNKASAIRSGNAFLNKESFIVGRRNYDKRGTCGTHHYEHVFHADNFDEVLQSLKENGYTIYAVDNIKAYNPQNIFDCDFPKKSAFVMGEEQRGLDEDTIRKCDGMVYIEQFGSVRSMNVACAASCIMMEYSRRYRYM